MNDALSMVTGAIAGIALGIVVTAVLQNGPTQTKPAQPTTKTMPAYAVEYYEDGARARKANVPAEANPWVGRNGYHAEAWLEGWMDANPQIEVEDE